MMVNPNVMQWVQRNGTNIQYIWNTPFGDQLLNWSSLGCTQDAIIMAMMECSVVRHNTWLSCIKNSPTKADIISLQW